MTGYCRCGTFDTAGSIPMDHGMERFEKDLTQRVIIFETPMTGGLIMNYVEHSDLCN